MSDESKKTPDKQSSSGDSAMKKKNRKKRSENTELSDLLEGTYRDDYQLPDDLKGWSD